MGGAKSGWVGQGETGRGLGVASGPGSLRIPPGRWRPCGRRGGIRAGWRGIAGRTQFARLQRKLLLASFLQKPWKKASGPCRKSALPRRAGCPPKCPGFTPALHRASPHDEIRLLRPAPALALLSPDAGPANQVSIAPATARSMESLLLPKRSAQRCGQCRAMPGLCPYVQVRK